MQDQRDHRDIELAQTIDPVDVVLADPETQQKASKHQKNKEKK